MRVQPHHWVVLSNWISRIGSVSVQIFTIPLLSHLLTAPEFAAYAILASLLAWYQLSDFGFGSSTQNCIAEAKAKDEPWGHYVSVAALSAITTFIVGCIILGFASSAMAKALLGKLDLSTSVDTSIIVWASGTLLLGNAVGQISQKIFYALGQGIVANVITLLNNICVFAILLFIVKPASPHYRLIGCILAYTVPMGISGLLSMLFLLLRHGSFGVYPLLNHFKTLRPKAFRFWIFSLIGSAVLNVDYIIMSQTLIASDIATYNILFRVVWVGMTLYSGLLLATQPVFVKMGVENNQRLILSTIRTYIFFGITAAIIFGIILDLFIDEILELVSPQLSLKISSITILLFCIYVSVRIWTDTYSAVLQSLNQIDVFLKITPAQAIISISAQIALATYYGLNGILLGIVISFLGTTAWILPKHLENYWRNRSA